MPNRYIRESAIESEAVNSLSWQGEVFYRRLLNRVDDFGRYTANVPLLRASLFPLQLDKVRDSDIARSIAECVKSGLLYVYSADSKQFLVINKWEQGRAKESKHPPPPVNICEHMKTYVYRCEHMSPTPTPTPTPTPISDSDPNPSSREREEAIYQAYPRKVGKTDALKAIARVVKAGADPQHLALRTQMYASAVSAWPEAEKRFVPHPSTWYARGSYDDDPKTWVRSVNHVVPWQRPGVTEADHANGF
jgi:hypothetical protein